MNGKAPVLTAPVSTVPACLRQTNAPIDVQTAHRAAARLARTRTIQAWPAGWYRQRMGSRLPPAVAGGDRAAAVDVHQLRAGHWSSSTQWRYRVGQSPSQRCAQCEDPHCSAALCPVLYAGRGRTPRGTSSCAARP